MVNNKFEDAHAFAGMQRNRFRKPLLAAATSLFCCTALTSPAFAADEEPNPDEIVVTGSLGALPIENVGSVFGFDKTIVETPRSASTISSEQIERFGTAHLTDRNPVGA